MSRNISGAGTNVDQSNERLITDNYESERFRQTPPSPIGGSDLDLDAFAKKPTSKNKIKKYKGNYADQARKLSKLVHFAKRYGQDPKKVKVRYSQDEEDESDSWMDSQSVLSSSALSQQHELGDDDFIEKAMKEAMQTRIKRERIVRKSTGAE